MVAAAQFNWFRRRVDLSYISKFDGCGHFRTYLIDQ
jgi:hypothetical protein